MARSERLIKPGDSWFSPKAIEVAPYELIDWGRALIR